MTIKEINYKVPNGKLIRIQANLEDNFLKEIKIAGDFFLYPEESIELIEESLRGKELAEEEIKRVLEGVIKKHSLKLLGVSERDFVVALMKLK